MKRGLAPTFKVRVSGGFILLFALIYFFDGSGFIASALPAVTAHEAGHVLVMRLFGARAHKLELSVSGLSLDYIGELGPKGTWLTAAAGPVFGIAYAFIAARLGMLWDSEPLLMSAGFSLILSAFNLLPALPLDGGRVLRFFLSCSRGEAYSKRALERAGLIISFLLLCIGFYFLISRQGYALFFAGVWLLAVQGEAT